MPAPLILSVYHGYHDSAVTVATPDRVLVHLLAERHFGHKNLRLDAAGMDELVAAALQYVGADIAACGRLLLASWGSPHPTDATAVTVGGRALSVTRTRHHRNHAYSSTVRPTDGSLVLCFDGGSEDGYATLYDVHNGTLANLDVLDDTLLTGKFYGTATQVVLQPQFIRAHAADTGKLLGLSAFGSYSTEIEKLVLANLAEVNALHFDDPGDLRTRMGLSDDYHQPWRDQRRADFAHTVQRMWEHELLDTLAPHAGDRPILLVGGCAHNVLANSVLSRSGLFPEVRVPPAPGDGGQSLGAVFDAYPRTVTACPYLGRCFAPVTPADAPAVAARVTADLLAGRVVGLYQNESEIGPRALGNRSILALASDADNHHRVSIAVKGREPYRPLGPVALAESLPLLVESTADHRYLAFAPQATSLGVEAMPAAIHVDGTTRIQSVTEHQNPVLYHVLRQLRADAGELALINTSLNVAGKPIADTPADAMECFETTALDVLYLGSRRHAKNGAGRVR